MLVGGDICKALLKQEIRFSVLVPWTSLRFVVGFVLFFRGSMEIYEVFLWGLGSIYGKGDWDAKPTCSTALAPSYGDTGWSNEHQWAQGGCSPWRGAGLHGAGTAERCGSTTVLVPPCPPLPFQLGPGSGPGRSVPRVRSAAETSSRACPCYLEKPAPGRRSPL